jgi:hypothetical protein
MKKENNMKKNDLKLFGTAFLQVFLVAANTYFISQVAWIGIAICGFSISYVWTINVQRVTFGNVIDRIIYASGAMTGGLLGVLVSKMIL